MTVSGEMTLLVIVEKWTLNRVTQQCEIEDCIRPAYPGAYGHAMSRHMSSTAATADEAAAARYAGLNPYS